MLLELEIYTGVMFHHTGHAKFGENNLNKREDNQAKMYQKFSESAKLLGQ